MTASGIALPLEIRSIERSCIICFEDLKWPTFCPQCKSSACYNCLSDWFRKKKECPTCRMKMNLRVQERELYACPQDGKLVQFYCKQCLVCCCDTNSCQGWLDQHGSHEVSSLDDLRAEIKASVEMMEAEIFITSVHKTLERFKKLLVKKSTPLQLVRASPKLLQEIVKFKKISKLSNSLNKPTAVNKNGKSSKNTVKRLKSSPLAKRPESTGADRYGNHWELTVNPEEGSSSELCVIIDP